MAIDTESDVDVDALRRLAALNAVMIVSVAILVAACGYSLVAMHSISIFQKGDLRLNLSHVAVGCLFVALMLSFFWVRLIYAIADGYIGLPPIKVTLPILAALLPILWFVPTIVR